MNNIIEPLYCLDSSSSELKNRWIGFNFDTNLIKNIVAIDISDRNTSGESNTSIINYEGVAPDLNPGTLEMDLYAFCYSPESTKYFIFLINNKKNLCRFELNTALETMTFKIAYQYNPTSGMWNPLRSNTGNPVRITHFIEQPAFNALSQESQKDLDSQYAEYQNSQHITTKEEINSPTLWDRYKEDNPDFENFSKKLGSRYPISSTEQLHLNTHINTQWCMLKRSTSTPLEYIKALLLVLANNPSEIDHQLSEDIYNDAMVLKDYLKPENMHIRDLTTTLRIRDVYDYYIKAICNEIIHIQHNLQVIEPDKEVSSKTTKTVSNRVVGFFSSIGNRASGLGKNQVVYSALNNDDNKLINNLSNALLHTNIYVDESLLTSNNPIPKLHVRNTALNDSEAQMLQLFEEFIDEAEPAAYGRERYQRLNTILEFNNRLQSEEQLHILPRTINFISGLIDGNYAGYEGLANTISMIHQENRDDFIIKLHRLQKWLTMALDVEPVLWLVFELEYDRPTNMSLIDNPLRMEFLLNHFIQRRLGTSQLDSRQLESLFYPPQRRANYHYQLVDIIKNLSKNEANIPSLIKIFTNLPQLAYFLRFIPNLLNANFNTLFEELRPNQIKNLLNQLLVVSDIGTQIENTITDFINIMNSNNPDKSNIILNHLSQNEYFKLVAISMFISDFVKEEYAPYRVLPDRIKEQFSHIPNFKEQLKTFKKWATLARSIEDISSIKEDILNNTLRFAYDIEEIIYDPKLLNYFLSLFTAKELKQYFSENSSYNYYAHLQNVILNNFNSLETINDLYHLVKNLPIKYLAIIGQSEFFQNAVLQNIIDINSFQEIHQALDTLNIDKANAFAELPIFRDSNLLSEDLSQEIENYLSQEQGPSFQHK